MKKIKMIVTLAVISAMTVLAGCSKDNDKTGTVSTATGDVADGIDLEGISSATVIPGAGDDKDGGVASGSGESSDDSNDGMGDNKEDAGKDENGDADGNVNKDDENADRGNSSDEASEDGNDVNGSQSGSSGDESGNTNGNTASKPAASIKTPTSSTTTSTGGSSSTGNGNQGSSSSTGSGNQSSTSSGSTGGSTNSGSGSESSSGSSSGNGTTVSKPEEPTIVSYIILVDVKVETMTSTYGTLVLWEIEHDDPEQGYPYTTSRTGLSAELIDKWIKESGAKDLFISACCFYIGETYGPKLGGYVIGQEEKIVDVAFVTEDGNYYLVEDPSCGVGVYARYDINETIGCVYSDGTKVYY